MGRKPKYHCPVCDVEMTRAYTRPTGESHTPVGYVCPHGHIELEEGPGRDHIMRVILPEASEDELTHAIGMPREERELLTSLGLNPRHVSGWQDTVSVMDHHQANQEEYRAWREGVARKEREYQRYTAQATSAMMKGSTFELLAPESHRRMVAFLESRIYHLVDKLNELRASHGLEGTANEAEHTDALGGGPYFLATDESALDWPDTQMFTAVRAVINEVHEMLSFMPGSKAYEENGPSKNTIGDFVGWPPEEEEE